jgi:hypothetical protein
MSVTLSAVELFTVSTAIVSLVFNILQFRKHKERLDPISNTLRSLFNEIKGTSNWVNWVQQVLFNPQNPLKEIEALRWDYGHFCGAISYRLEAMQETVVGVLISLNPEDKLGKGTFRASDYGLTEEDRYWRQQAFEQRKLLQAAAPQEAPARQEAPAPQEATAPANQRKAEPQADRSGHT